MLRENFSFLRTMRSGHAQDSGKILETQSGGNAPVPQRAREGAKGAGGRERQILLLFKKETLGRMLRRRWCGKS